MDQHTQDLVEVDSLDGDRRLPEFFGPAWSTVERFHDLLVRHGVERGLLGPREGGRLWERHLLNSAALVPFLGDVESVIDLGSGAGLPGVVVAAMRPDLRVTLLEPMERRSLWLTEVVEVLGLHRAVVLRGRAEGVTGLLQADVVVARAVGALDVLYRWGVPLVQPGGRLVVLKGARASEEVQAARREARRLGIVETSVHVAGTIEGVEPTHVVVAVLDGAEHGRR